MLRCQQMLCTAADAGAVSSVAKGGKHMKFIYTWDVLTNESSASTNLLLDSWWWWGALRGNAVAWTLPVTKTRQGSLCLWASIGVLRSHTYSCSWARIPSWMIGPLLFHFGNNESKLWILWNWEGFYWIISPGITYSAEIKLWIELKRYEMSLWVIFGLITRAWYLMAFRIHTRRYVAFIWLQSRLSLWQSVTNHFLLLNWN